MEFITQSAEQTKELGKKLANSLIESKEKRRIIALIGDLGSGKTTFTQGFCNGFGIKGRVISPTFILVRKYEILQKFNKFKNIYHIDLYRLEGNMNSEIKNIGLDDYWNDRKNIVLIEWAEKIKDILPKETLWISFEHLKSDSRKITFNKVIV